MKLNADQTVAVSTEVYFQPMKDCPIGVKVQLLGPGGVAVYAQWDGKDPQWQGWAALPRVCKP